MPPDDLSVGESRPIRAIGEGEGASLVPKAALRGAPRSTGSRRAVALASTSAIKCSALGGMAMGTSRSPSRMPYYVSVM